MTINDVVEHLIETAQIPTNFGKLIDASRTSDDDECYGVLIFEGKKMPVTKKDGKLTVVKFQLKVVTADWRDD